MVIRVLPAEVVNQIAAGEVVERPFSVVKELVENSLDAGAKRVRVEIEEGGRRSVRVIDDGEGFEPRDLPLAFASHATSKLSTAGDLERIATLGFRGEALASIGSVSRACIRSRRRGAESGFEVHSEAPRDVRPCGCPPGTVVEARDLFYNTPARRRFLRGAAAEQARIKELLARLALAHLDVDFTLAADGREVLRLPAGDDLRGRVRRAFGGAVADALIDVEQCSGDYVVHGLAADPDLTRRDSALELLWVNGRLARDRGAVQAIRQAYREFLMHGRRPVYFLRLELPPREVDVNVHPTKAEVRFVQARRACGLLHQAVRSMLSRRSGLARGAALSVRGRDELPRARSGFPDLPRDLFGRETPAGSPPPPPAGRPAAGERHPFRDLQCDRVLRVLDLYLVLEGRDGLVVVDQHALHERVLYEKLERRDLERGARVQRLLTPEVVELTPSDKVWLLEARHVLAEEGLVLEDFGGDAVAVHGVPAVLGRADPRKILEAFLAGEGSEARPRARAAIVERFHSMACRGAVMSGDRLSEAEIRTLLEDARRLRHPHNCPHGRPTVLTFGRAELERYFRRIPL